MIVTILGLLVAAGAAITAVVMEKDGNITKKLILGLFAVAAFVAGVISAVSENGQKAKAEAKIVQLQTTVDGLHTQLGAQSVLLKLVSLTVGDLGILNQLSDGRKYYVRIAADTNPDNLEPFKNRIERQFPGADASHMAVVRQVPGSRNFELVFGDGLDPAAAQVFKQLADSSKFPPKDEPAEIHLDPK